MSTLSSIKRLHEVCDLNCFHAATTLDYLRQLEALIALCNAVADYEGESEALWCIGEDNGVTISDMIPAAYWHANEWHAGQFSDGYKLLCAAGRVFSPGMSCGPDEGSTEHDCYMQLDAMASEHFKATEGVTL